MVNLREKFGRRMWLIASAVAVSIIACICAIASINVVSAVTGDEDHGIFDLTESYITTNVQAPRNASFDAKWNYQFEFLANSDESNSQYIEYDDGKEYAKDVKGEASTPISNKGNYHLIVPVKAEQGVIDQTTPAYDTITPTANTYENNMYYTAKGHGTSGIGETSESGITYTPNASVFGYIHSVKVSDLLLYWWGYNPEADNSSLFPTDGKYTSKVTCSMEGTATPTNTWTTSRSSYLFSVWVKTIDTKKAITGCTYIQVDDDKGTALPPNKKDPREWPSKSNHQYGVLKPGLTTEYAGYVYEGFTYQHTLKLDPTVAGDLEKFYLKKEVTSNVNTDNMEFDFTATFYANNWNEKKIDGFYAKTTLTGVICPIKGGSSAVPTLDPAVGAVTFTITHGTPASDGVISEPATATPSDNFKLKKNQAIVFDGITTYNPAGGTAVTADKLPAGCYYSFTESLANSAATPLTNFKDCAVTGFVKSALTGAGEEEKVTGTAGASGGVTVNYFSSTSDPTYTTPVHRQAIIDSPATATTNFVNYARVLNAIKSIPTGFLIDAAPYVLMIGIPLIALAAWVISRKRKYNN